jgi:LmbE family N-acetylglucosaminyl deacetylase
MQTALNIALAITAHPDDIEFSMAGTLLLLKGRGYEIHYHTVASGSCGSAEYNAATTRTVRRRESQQAARLLGAHYHPSLVDDLEIFYEDKLIRQVAALIREVAPTILLLPSPQDYMEDHTNACRVAVTAAFARGMRNYRTQPRRPITEQTITLYHAMPHGLQDGMCQRIVPDAFVNTTAVHATKRTALAAHESQKHWLDISQGMDSYLKTLDELSLTVGKLSGSFLHAEGWRRHSHLGFCAAEADPLRAALGQNYQCAKPKE